MSSISAAVRLLLLAVLFSIALAQDCEAAEGGADDATRLSAKQRLILDSYQHSLAGLRTGECRITERHSLGKETRIIHLAFDFDRDLIRSDTESVGRKTYRLILTPRDLYLNVAGDRWVSHLDRDEPIPLSQATPLDLRTIGISGMGDYLVRTSLMKLTKAWNSKRVTAVEPIKSSGELRWRIVFTKDEEVRQQKGPPVFQRLWHVVTVNPETGYCPFESEWYLKGDFKPLGEDIGVIDGKLQQSTTFEWEQKGETFVPKQIRFVGHPAAPSTIDVAFEWESVNQPIEDTRFSVDDFNLLPGTRIAREKPNGEHFIDRQIPGRPEQ